jgi:glycoprotein endo-alpha-1,2-mannosidase
VAIFYYPWYATPAHDGAWDHWNQNSHRPPLDLYSRFYPARGPYSSNDVAVVDQQMAEMAAAGVDEVVSSWWGRGSVEDARLQMLLNAARRRRLQPAIHIEPYPNRTADTVLLDIKYLAGLGVHDIFVYHPRDIPAADWAALRPQLPPGVRLFAGTELVGFAAAGLFDGFYTYDFINYGGSKFTRLCNQAHAVHLLCAPSVGPGYDGVRAGEAAVLSGRRNGVTYDNLWTAALARHGDDHELQRVGRGDTDRGGGPAPRLPQLRRRLGPHRRRRPDRVSDAHGLLDRALPFRPLRWLKSRQCTPGWWLIPAPCV